MSDPNHIETAIPLVEEQLRIDKRRVETGRVRVHTRIEEQLARIAEELEAEEISIEKVPVNQEVSAVPPVRQEGDVLVIPLVEEVAVVQKRLFLREELRIRKHRRRERIEEAIPVRRMRAHVERVPSGDPSDPRPTRRAGAPRIRRKPAPKNS